ncbi:MAG TPA: hypothetical protein PLU53_05215 [Bacteroidia bacterium]|nr:hypothetical protein [Bacteroidia bacterium]
MNKTTTQKDLLLYAYNETKLLDSDRIQRAVDGDPVIAGEYREITSMLELLDSAGPSPSEKSIQNILSHA